MMNVCAMNVCENVAIDGCDTEMSVAFFVIESALLEVSMKEIFAFMVIVQLEYVPGSARCTEQFLIVVVSSAKTCDNL